MVRCRKGFGFLASVMFLGSFVLSNYASAQYRSAPNKINVMFYNVYNLFDNSKDKGKDDWTWLPSEYPKKKENCMKISNPGYRKLCLETNWTNAHLALKVSQLRKAISANKRSFVPDILGLCEIENKGVVQALAKGLGYDPRAVITSNSPDRRGIDVALVYKPSANLKYRSHKEYKLPASGALNKPTRNILEVEFVVGGKHQLFVYVNHWPSQGAKAPARMVAAAALRKVIDARTKANPKVNILVTGDFNTIPADRPHPFHDGILKPTEPLRQLYDVHTTFMRHPKIPDELKKKMPAGTYYYTRNRNWNLFDRFFVNKQMFDGKGIDFAIETYRIHAPKFLTKPWELRNGSNRVEHIPYRYNSKTLDPKLAGYSDHFGIRGAIVIK